MSAISLNVLSISSLNFDCDSFRVTYDNCVATVYACTPKISGATCPDEYGEKTEIPCTGFSCMAFNPSDFAISINEEDCTANICAISNGITISGHVGIDDCCETDSSLITVPNARNIEFGRGIQITEYNEGESADCCEPGKEGWVKIDVCTPRISGAECLGDEYPRFEHGSSYNEGDKVVGSDGNLYEAIVFNADDPVEYPDDWLDFTEIITERVNND